MSNEEEVKHQLEKLWETHAKASHVCYAWQLGKNYEHYRANDDGEPNNSAGMPIYGQIQAAELTQTLVAVVRYYGGTNLGVGGLITAYKTAAKMTLEAGKIVSCTIKADLQLSFEYPKMNDVMRIIKEENLEITSQELYLDCKIIIAVRLKELNSIQERFDAVYGIEVRNLTN